MLLIDAITDLTREKGISFFSIPNPRIKPEKNNLVARWLFNTGWTVNNYSFGNAKKVCHKHFEESCFEAELQTRLRFSIRKCLKPDAVPTIFHFNPTQSHVQQERKERAHEAHKKAKQRKQDLSHQVVGRKFRYRWYNKMAKKGREIIVNFTFVMDKFASARPLNLLIIYPIPLTSGSYNSSCWLFV